VDGGKSAGGVGLTVRKIKATSNGPVGTYPATLGPTIAAPVPTCVPGPAVTSTTLVRDTTATTTIAEPFKLLLPLLS
jgi:hypothetical protein